MVPGRAVFLQPLLAPAVSSVQPHINVGPAKAWALLGIWMDAFQPCGKSDNLRGVDVGSRCRFPRASHAHT